MLKLRIALTLLSCLLCASAFAEVALGPPMQDCNRNGVEDAVDIAFGGSSDANCNGVPDECESLASNTP